MNKILKITFILVSLISFTAFAQEDKVFSESVEQNPLGEASLDEVGLLTEKDGGFSANMWQGSDAGFISLLLAKLPTEVKSPVITDIKKRLLVSIAEKPESIHTPDAIFFARMKNLASMGDSEDIASILRKVPESLRNEHTDSIYAVSLFAGQNYEDGCKMAQSAMQKYNNMFWRKIILVCQANSGKKEELDLSMKLLKEDGKKLKDDFTKIIAGLQKKDAEKAAAQKDFIKAISQEVFPEKQEQQPFPHFRTHLLSMPDEYLNNWVEWMNSIGDSSKRIESIERFYALLESLGEKITVKEWREMAMYSLANNIRIPTFVWTNLLQDAISNKRQAEMGLIVIYLADDELVKLSPELLRWIIYATDEMKFKKDAQRILVEAMGAK